MNMHRIHLLNSIIAMRCRAFSLARGMMIGIKLSAYRLRRGEEAKLLISDQNDQHNPMN